MTIRNWYWGNLRPMRYGMIMVDPPWRYEIWSPKGEQKSPLAKYDCMTLAEVMGLPVIDLAAPDCLVWLWATNPMLDQAIDVLKHWGFAFKTAGHWLKRTRHGKLSFGTGYILRSAGEPFLIGTIGKPYTSRSVRSVIEGPLREHSRKPDEAYVEAERLVPNVWRADLFSREARPGWEAFGNQAGKFNKTGGALDGEERQDIHSAEKSGA